MEQFKLSFDEPKFFVNEKRGAVTCVMTYKVKGNPAAMYLVRSMGNLRERDTYDNPFLVGFKSTYTAYVCEGDTFDEEIGKKVARTNAESQAYAHVSNLLGNMINKYYNMLADLHEGFYAKAESVIDHNETYLERF